MKPDLHSVLVDLRELAEKSVASPPADTLRFMRERGWVTFQDGELGSWSYVITRKGHRALKWLPVVVGGSTVGRATAPVLSLAISAIIALATLVTAYFAYIDHIHLISK